VTQDKTTAPGKMTAALDDLLGGGLGGMLAGLFEQMDWGEDEIKRARKRHPAQADLLWHAFKLLTPTHELMGTEFVYRSHCRQILERLAAGQDTRPGTDAEICCACADASQLAPLTESAAGLYGRAFARAFPGQSSPWEGAQEHYEALRAGLINDLERESRRKLTQADRRVTEIDCGGMHHGEQVTCTASVPKLAKAA
jgi:hypothetical protein